MHRLAGGIRFEDGSDFSPPRGLPRGVTAVLGSVDAPERALVAACCASEVRSGRPVVVLAVGRSVADHEAVCKRLGVSVGASGGGIGVFGQAVELEGSVLTLEGVLGALRCGVEEVARACEEGGVEVAEVGVVVDDIGVFGDLCKFGDAGGVEVVEGVVEQGLGWEGSGLTVTRVVFCGCGDAHPATEPRDLVAITTTHAALGAAAARSIATRGRVGPKVVAELVAEAAEKAISAQRNSEKDKSGESGGGGGGGESGDGVDDGKTPLTPSTHPMPSSSPRGVGGGVVGVVRSYAQTLLTLTPLPSGRSREVAGVVRLLRRTPVGDTTSSPFPTKGLLRLTEGTVQVTPSL